MAPVRVLVIDDSSAVRRIIAKVINEDPDFTLVGSAENGEVGVQLAQELRPDIITCDVEMPVLDGLSTVTELRRLRIDTPIVMFSWMTEAGSRITLEALARGATDYVPKPTGVNDLGEALDQLRSELLPRLRALTTNRVRPLTRSDSQPVVSHPTSPRRKPTMPPRAVLIGSSTGGPLALEAVLGAISRPLPVPVFVVQHIPPVFSTMLAERLDRSTPMTVVEATANAPVRNGVVYLAPGGQHMRVVQHGPTPTIKLSDEPPVNSCRPSVDVLFDSAAKVYGDRLLGVILTGMGSDGVAGSRSLTNLGAQIVVQDEDTSVVWGMPGLVAEAGLASKILPLDEISGAIERRVLAGHRPAEVPMS